MKLNLIYGRAGRGKTTFCIDSISKRMNDDSTKILLVPEQLSFESERKLIEKIGGVGLNNVHVLSFKRMAYWVFKECGGISKKHIDKCGKSMLIYSILEEVEDDLRVFSKSAAYSGFVDNMLNIISEFKRYNVNSEVIVEMKSRMGENSLLYNKLDDIGKIYASFDEKMHKNYIDGDDDLLLMKEKLKDCNIFDGASIWIDEFSGFTPQQYDIIEELLPRVREINVTLNMGIDDKNNGLEDVIEPLLYTEDKLLKVCEKIGISIGEPVHINHKDKHKYESRELLFLEENYFKYPFSSYKEEVNDISIFKSLNPYGEVENLAGEIKRITREEGGRFNEIAVVSRDIERYENIIESIFHENEIPFFMDKKKEASANPIVIMITSALEIYNRGWNYESVFRFLKSGIIPWDDEYVDLLENYALMSGIKGKAAWNDDDRWYRKLIDTTNLREEYCRYYEIEDVQITYEELINEIKKGDIKSKEEVQRNISGEDMKALFDLAPVEDEREIFFREKMERIFKIDYLRGELVSKVTVFHNWIKGNKKCEDIALGLFRFLEEVNMYEMIQEKIEIFKDRGELELSDEYGHIWNAIIEVLDQMVECFKGTKMKVDKFTEIFCMGLRQHKMGFIPNTLDQVLVSSVERVKSHKTKYLFILGVNDGVFPKANFEEGILSDIDRMTLKEEGVELAKDTKGKTFDEQYLIYTSLSLPSRYLRLSYPVGDSEGKTLRSSIIIARMKSLFPKIKESNNILSKNIDECITSKTTAMNNLIISLRREEKRGEIHEFWREVYKCFMENEEYREMINTLIDNFDYSNTVEQLSRESVKNLYSRDNLFSVSKLEKYNECPFSYFIKYGLRAKERKTFELSAPDLGTFMHHVIEEFSNVVSTENMKWGELEDQWCRDKLNELIDSSMEDKVGRIFKTTPKYKYFGNRIKRVMSKSIWAVVQHMKRGEFVPFGYEMEFGGKDYSPIEIELEDATVVKLVGKIDRVDRLLMDSDEYFRIIDYKSGNKALKLSQIYYGLQLQLITYLDAILNIEEEKFSLTAMPAGVFYFKIDDPIIKQKKRVSEEELSQEILKTMKLKGLVLKDSEIITKMDNELKEGISLIIPAGITKKGDVTSKAGSNVATIEEFKLLRNHVRNKLRETCTRILEGNIDIEPYKTTSGDTPCEYCDFSNICAFDPMFEKNNYKIISDIKDDVVWKMMKEEDKE